ncbi:hypothetical protein [Novacetimonas cocois]|uniref:hypothetical protein n=1 Tax=Novacetimonas cocois TaxID=1747507 RepID=UPI0014020C0F|nr:hypothetical protein [Novacetimonas cocois]
MMAAYPHPQDLKIGSAKPHAPDHRKLTIHDASGNGSDTISGLGTIPRAEWHA